MRHFIEYALAYLRSEHSKSKTQRDDPGSYNRPNSPREKDLGEGVTRSVAT